MRNIRCCRHNGVTLLPQQQAAYTAKLICYDTMLIHRYFAHCSQQEERESPQGKAGEILRSLVLGHSGLDHGATHASSEEGIFDHSDPHVVTRLHKTCIAEAEPEDGSAFNSPEPVFYCGPDYSSLQGCLLSKRTTPSRPSKKATMNYKNTGQTCKAMPRM